MYRILSNSCGVSLRIIIQNILLHFEPWHMTERLPVGGPSATCTLWLYTLNWTRSVNNPRMVSLYGSTQVQLVMLHLHFPWESFVVRQAFLFTITNHATRYNEMLVTRCDSALAWRKARAGLCVCETVAPAPRSKRFSKACSSKLPWGRKDAGCSRSWRKHHSWEAPNNGSSAS